MNVARTRLVRAEHGVDRLHQVVVGGEDRQRRFNRRANLQLLRRGDARPGPHILREVERFGGIRKFRGASVTVIYDVDKAVRPAEPVISQQHVAGDGFQVRAEAFVAPAGAAGDEAPTALHEVPQRRLFGGGNAGAQVRHQHGGRSEGILPIVAERDVGVTARQQPGARPGVRRDDGDRFARRAA